jgi:Aspartyl protease
MNSSDDLTRSGINIPSPEGDALHRYREPHQDSEDETPATSGSRATSSGGRNKTPKYERIKQDDEEYAIEQKEDTGVTVLQSLPFSGAPNTGLPWFTGKNITSFLREFDTLCNENKKSFRDRCERVPRFSAQPIRAVIWEMIEWKQRDWISLKKCMKKEWKDEDEEVLMVSYDYLKRLCARKRGKKEDLTTYFRQVRLAAETQLGLGIVSEYMAVNLLMDGLPDDYQRKLLKRCKLDKDDPSTFKWDKAYPTAKSIWEEESAYQQFDETTKINFRELVNERETQPSLARTKDRRERREKTRPDSPSGAVDKPVSNSIPHPNQIREFTPLEHESKKIENTIKVERRFPPVPDMDAEAERFSKMMLRVEGLERQNEMLTKQVASFPWMQYAPAVQQQQRQYPPPPPPRQYGGARMANIQVSEEDPSQSQEYTAGNDYRAPSAPPHPQYQQQQGFIPRPEEMQRHADPSLFEPYPGQDRNEQFSSNTTRGYGRGYSRGRGYRGRGDYERGYGRGRGYNGPPRGFEAERCWICDKPGHIRITPCPWIEDDICYGGIHFNDRNQIMLGPDDIENWGTTTGTYVPFQKGVNPRRILDAYYGDYDAARSVAGLSTLTEYMAWKRARANDKTKLSFDDFITQTRKELPPAPVTLAVRQRGLRVDFDTPTGTPFGTPDASETEDEIEDLDDIQGQLRALRVQAARSSQKGKAKASESGHGGTIDSRITKKKTAEAGLPRAKSGRPGQYAGILDSDELADTITAGPSTANPAATVDIETDDDEDRTLPLSQPREDTPMADVAQASMTPKKAVRGKLTINGQKLSKVTQEAEQKTMISILARILNADIGPIKVIDMVTASKPLAEAFGWKKFWTMDDGDLRIFGEVVVPNIRTFFRDVQRSQKQRDDQESEDEDDRKFGARYIEPLAWGLCPWILVQINGVQIRALVDSGAECNCMARSLADTLGIPIERPKERIRNAIGFDGKKIEGHFVGQISSLRVIIGDSNGKEAVVRTTFQVSRETDPKFKILLGSPFRVNSCLSMATDVEGDCKITVVCQDSKKRVAVVAGIGEFQGEEKTKAMILSARAPKAGAGRK